MAADAIEVVRPSPALAESAEIDANWSTPADIVEAEHAPGWPGSPARWTSSAKSGVGTALSPLSHVWFTISHGILNEIYYPRIDQACTRDLGLIVTDGATFFSEEKRDAQSVVRMLEDGVPAYLLVNTCKLGRYRIEKTVLADPRRDVILQHVRFVPLKGAIVDYRLHVLLAPHLGRRPSITRESAHGDAAEAGAARSADDALVLAYPWRLRIESGRAKSVTDLAEQERLTDAHACRLLPLSWLGPDIVEAILDGRQPKGLGHAEMLRGIQLRCDEQPRSRRGSAAGAPNPPARAAPSAWALPPPLAGRHNVNLIGRGGVQEV